MFLAQSSRAWVVTFVLWILVRLSDELEVPGLYWLCCSSEQNVISQLCSLPSPACPDGVRCWVCLVVLRCSTSIRLSHQEWRPFMCDFIKLSWAVSIWSEISSNKILLTQEPILEFKGNYEVATNFVTNKEQNKNSQTKVHLILPPPQALEF